MKIDANKSDIQVIGDITEFKTGIDPKNLEFITTLLSSNLYSAPEQSFIREIVSNAWDSHVEAKTTDTPVIIKIGKENKSITIRDYGTGLSPERFKEVYCNIGSSTKRNTNDYIGGFGIGKYSSLACSNTVYITSYYEGKEYKYLMVKSGNTITTNLLATLDTEEKNGVMVTINIDNSSISKYLEALKYIVFFPNVYLDSSNYIFEHKNFLANEVVRSFNTNKIKRFDRFAAIEYSMDAKILLGNVLYPCNGYLLNNPESLSFLNKIKNTGIVISFEVGELNITPNRESIIYTSETIDIINKRIKEAKEEIENIIKIKLSKDFDDIYEYRDSLYSCSYNFIEDVKDYAYSTGGSFHLTENDLHNLNSFRGKHYNTNGIFYYMLNFSWDYKFYICDEKIFTHKSKVFRGSITNTGNNRNKVISVPEGYRFSNILKAYLREYYDGYVVLEGATEESIYNNIIKNLDIYKDRVDFKYFAKVISYTLFKCIKFIDFYNDKDFLEYKEEQRKDKVKIKDIHDVILHEANVKDTACIGYIINHTYKGIEEAIKHIKNIKRPVILDSVGPLNNEYAIASGYRNIAYIAINKKDLAEIKSKNLNNVVSLKWFTEEDSYIRKLHTAIVYLEDVDINRAKEVLIRIPDEIFKNDVIHILNMLEVGNDGLKYYKLARRNSIKNDSYIEHICKKLLDYMTKYEQAIKLLKDDSIYSYDKRLVDAIIIKEKLFRISYKSYKHVKQSKVINLLCRR